MEKAKPTNNATIAKVVGAIFKPHIAQKHDRLNDDHLVDHAQ